MKTSLVLAISVIFSVSLATGQCPNSTWIHFRNKCYFLKWEKADLYENIALCNQLNASLVSITSKEENNAVTRILYGNEFWLGLGRKANVSVPFYWFDGRPFAYNNWESDPSDLKYKYWAVHISVGHWYSVSPFDQYNQVCSINLKPSSSYKRTPNPADIKETLVEKQCPNSTWIRHGNKCYFVKEEEADLYENIDLCNQLNASMVSIASEAENIQVTRLISPDTPLWLGLGLDQKSNHSKEFHWFDGSPFVYSSWKYEPDVSDKYFGAYIVKGEWHNHYPYGFGRRSQMCSIDLNRTTPYKKTPNPADIKENLVPKQCPKSTWIRRGNKCYFVKREKADFYANIALCNQLNASLVSITSEEENIHVNRLIPPTGYDRGLWLGLGRKSIDSKEFYWFDGSPFEYNNWAGKPNDEVKRYSAAYLKEGKWHYYHPNAFDHYFQMCSINLKQNSPYKKTPNPADIKENLVPKQCPNSTWIRRGNKCYFVKGEEADLYDNIALCNQLNASLVSITSETENMHVTRLISPRDSLWLGLGQTSNDSKEFYWFDGSPFVYSNWWQGPHKSYKYFGAYLQKGAWFIDTALEHKIQVCSLDLTLKTSPKPTPIPAEFREISDQCPNTTWRRVGSKCIYFDTTNDMTYMENQALCKQLNATMVSIHSEKEDTQLLRLSRRKAFWIGLKKISSKDRLYEWEDGSPVTYENWDSQRPRHLRDNDWAAFSYFGTWGECRQNLYAIPGCQTFLFTEREDVSSRDSLLK